MVPKKYRDVRHFFIKKYGKKVGAFKFKIYLLQKNVHKQTPPKTKKTHSITKNKFRANIFIF
jgi:hypothetical protein